MTTYSYSIPIIPPKVCTTIIGDEPHELEDIIQRVCDAWYIKVKDLENKSRVEQLKYARWMIWHIAKGMGWSLKRIGNMFGTDYDHTTVINALKKLPIDVKKMPHVKMAYKRIVDLDPNPLLSIKTTINAN